MGKWAKYSRSYNKAWEKDPDLKAWIRPVPTSKEKAFCLFCNRELRAHHSDLLAHVRTSRHQKMETKFKQIIVNPEEPSASLVIDNITDSGIPEYHPNQNESVVDLRSVAFGGNTLPDDAIPEGLSLIQFGILTVSDRCSQGDMEDTSGDSLQALINSGTLPFPACVYVRLCVPDNYDLIKNTLTSWSDKMKVDVVLTTGGTGFSSRDVTPEATAEVIQKEANGMSAAITMNSLKITPMAMLSRAVCGIRHKTLIINLPGSKKGAMECFQIVVPILQHAVDQMNGITSRVAEIHNQMQHSSNMFMSPGCNCGPLRMPHNADDSILPDYENIDGRVARRLRTSNYPLVSIDYAHKMIMKEAAVIGVHSPNLVDCLGSYLVHDVISSINLPPFRASIKDGYAVLVSDGASRRKVLGAMAAGAQPEALEVRSGFCIRVSTGAPIPRGANAVVQVEDTKLMSELDDGKEEAEIEIVRAPFMMQDIRPVGFDVKMNDMVLEKHTRLGPSQIAILASIGKMQPTVFKKPVVAILSTGSELQEPGQTLRPGCIWDSNKYALLGFLIQHGYTVRDIGIARDNVDALYEHMTKALEEASVVITTGGVSMGEKDLVKLVLTTQFKAKIHFAQLFMKPGKPTTFATLNYKDEKKLVFALPGNPVSAVVTFNLLVLPALKSMAGDLNPLPKSIMAEMSHSYDLDPRPEYARATLTWPKNVESDNQAPKASTTGNQMSSRLMSMHKADALLVLPSHSPEKPTIEEGELIPAILLDHKV